MKLPIDPSILMKRNLDDILKELNAIDAIDLVTTSIEEVFAKVEFALRGSVFITNTCDARIDEQLKRQGFFRARKNAGTNLYQTVDEIWCPPDGTRIQIGRCNREREVLLYCSTIAQIAVREVMPTSGDFVTVSRLQHLPYHNRKILRFKMLGVVDESVSMEENTPEELRNKYIGFDQIFKNNEDVVKNNEIHKYLNRKFAEKVNEGEEHKYKLTIALTEYFMKEPSNGFEDKIDGIMYSSVKHEDELLNLVFDPKKAEQHMSITEGWVYHIVDNENPDSWNLINSFKVESDGKLKYE